jgi:hypothetical protein
MMEEDPKLHVFQCSCDVLPTCSDTRRDTAVFEHNSITPLADPCPHEAILPMGLIPVGTPTYGVAALSVYQYFDFRDPAEDYALIRFWPSSDSRSGRSGDLRLLVGDAKGHEIHIPARRGFYSFIANCGTTMVIVWRDHESSKVCLVRYVAGTVSTHELELPSSVAVAEISRISVDDYKGTVYLLSAAGILHCIPYA